MGVFEIGFGKHMGDKINSVPKDYLLWLANQKYNKHSEGQFIVAIEEAKKELNRRGIIPKHEIQLSPHSINRFYQRYAKAELRRENLLSEGGIYTYLLKLATEAYANIKEGEQKVRYKGFTFYFEDGEFKPTLKTIT